MRILVCVKRVPITGGRMVLTADEQALETRHLGFTISPHEECGVEEAVRIVEAGGGEVVVLTLGPPEAEEQLRDCLAIGADRATRHEHRAFAGLERAQRGPDARVRDDDVGLADRGHQLVAGHRPARLDPQVADVGGAGLPQHLGLRRDVFEQQPLLELRQIVKR